MAPSPYGPKLAHELFQLRYHIVLANGRKIALFDCVSRRQAKTLHAIFADPVSATIRWAAIENLLLAVGCEAVEGGGSRVKFVKDGVIAAFHRPHPEPEAKRYQVRDVREYLSKLGVEP